MEDLANEHRTIDQFLVLATLIAVTIVNIFTIAALVALPTLNAPYKVPAFVSLLGMVIVVIVQGTAVLEFLMSRRLPKRALQQSPLGIWRALTQSMEAGQYRAAESDAQAILNRMPYWPWGQLLLAIALIADARQPSSLKDTRLEEKLMVDMPQGWGPVMVAELRRSRLVLASANLSELVQRLNLRDLVRMLQEEDATRSPVEGDPEKRHLALHGRSIADLVLAREVASTLVVLDVTLQQANKAFLMHRIDFDGLLASDCAYLTERLNAYLVDGVVSSEEGRLAKRFSSWRSGRQMR